MRADEGQGQADRLPGCARFQCDCSHAAGSNSVGCSCRLPGSRTHLQVVRHAGSIRRLIPGQAQGDCVDHAALLA
eukprot:9423392-Karenia_brevis.AAC.1